MYTSDIWHGEEWKLLTWPANFTEHLNIMKRMHICRSSSVCSAKFTNVAYISASINTVKISILIVSRQRHSSWNRSRAAALNALDVFKLSVTTLSENRLSTCVQGTKRIIQTDSRTDSLVWSSLWTELTQNNESFANGHRSLPREK